MISYYNLPIAIFPRRAGPFFQSDSWGVTN